MTDKESNQTLPVLNPQGSDTEMLDGLLAETFEYFLKEMNPENGLIRDNTKPGAPASIAASGLAIGVFIVAVERGMLSRKDAAGKALTILRFFNTSHQGREPDATGYHGFYYHFLDMHSGKRAWNCELSTIDTALLMTGVLTALVYFNGSEPDEIEIQVLADALYKKVDWVWSLNKKKTISHGWKPESGFLKYRWDTGYSEAHLVYVLALGSPTFPIEPIGYQAWTATFEWKKIYGYEYVYAGPLFIHQLAQTWLNLKGVQDKYMLEKGIDYFENSRRATYVQRQYAIENPQQFRHYGKNSWGFTASNGPGPAKMKIDGRERRFYDYVARGVPYGIDDGTISPWAVASSLPFAPEIVLDAIRHAIERFNLKSEKWTGFDSSFNATFPEKTKNPNGWVSPWKFALNQGPVILMIENYQSGLLWRLSQQCPYIVKGLRCAGFVGGWLDD